MDTDGTDFDHNVNDLKLLQLLYFFSKVNKKADIYFYIIQHEYETAKKQDVIFSLELLVLKRND